MYFEKNTYSKINFLFEKAERIDLRIAYVFFFAWSVSILFLGIPLLHEIIGLQTDFGGESHDGYIELARNLVAVGRYSFSETGPAVLHRPPLYPLMLMPVVMLDARWQPYAVIVLNSAFYALTLTIFFALFRKLFGGAKAVIALVFIGMNPWLVYSNKNPMYISLFCALFALLLFLEWNYLKSTEVGNETRNSTQKLAFIGIIGGLISLTHGTGLPLFIGSSIILFILCGKHSGIGVTLLRVIIVFCFASLLVLPWTARNYFITHRVIPIASNAGVAYFSGNAYWDIEPPKSIGSNKYSKEYDHGERALLYGGVLQPHEKIYYFGLKDPNLDKELTARAVEQMKSSPTLLIKRVILNAYGFFFPSTHCFIIKDAPCEKEHFFITLYFVFLVTTALAGVMCRKLASDQSKFLKFAACYTVIYVLPFFILESHVGHNQYSYPAVFLLSISSSLFITRTRLVRDSHEVTNS